MAAMCTGRRAHCLCEIHGISNFVPTLCLVKGYRKVAYDASSLWLPALRPVNARTHQTSEATLGRGLVSMGDLRGIPGGLCE